MQAIIEEIRPAEQDEPSDLAEGESDEPSRRDQLRLSGRERKRGEHSAAEWVTLGISLGIVLGLIAVTTYFYLIASTEPVMIEVEPRTAEVYQAGDRFYLPVTVRNHGGETGEEVKVRATLTGSTGRQETADLMVQFLAGGGSSRAVVAFASDPRQGQIEAGVISYLEP